MIMEMLRKRIFLIPLMFSVVFSVIFMNLSTKPETSSSSEIVQTVEEADGKEIGDNTNSVSSVDEVTEEKTEKEEKETLATEVMVTQKTETTTEKLTTQKSEQKTKNETKTESKTESKEENKKSSDKKETKKENEDEEKIPTVNDVKFTEKEETVYATGNVFIRTGPYRTYDYVDFLETGDKITRIATGDNGWSKVIYKNKTCYVRSTYLSTEKVTKPTYVATVKPSTSKNNTSTNSVGMLSSCGMTSKELKGKLKKSLKNYSEYFIEAEKTYGVNAAFLAAVAALESGWGESYVAQKYNNLFGWKGGSGYRNFSSPRECIMTIASRLKTNYLTPGGSCFRGYTIAAINKCYNGSSHWLNNVTSIYNSIIR